MKLHLPKQRPLVLALYVAIAVAPVNSQATTFIEAIGEDKTAVGPYDTGVETGAAGIAMFAAAGEAVPGTVTPGRITGSDVIAHSAGDGTMTVLSYTGGTIDLRDSEIRATGDGSVAVTAANGGVVRLAGGSATSTGAQWAAGLMSDAGTIEARDVTVLASGTGTADAPIAGAIVENGGHLALEGGSVGTLGNYAHGVWAQGAGTIVEAAGAGISTAGSSAFGVLAMSGAKVALSDATVETEGDGAGAVDIRGGATFDAIDTSIAMSGQDGVGVYVSGNGSLASLVRSNITTSGDYANGIMADQEAHASLDSTTVETSGYLADAVIVGTKATMEGKSATIATTGENAYAVLAYDGGSARLTDAAVNTQGTASFGVSAIDPDSRIEITGGTVSTTGERAIALDAYQSGNVTTHGVRITTKGKDASGISAFGAGSRIDIAGGTLETAGETANAAFAATAGRITIRDASVAARGEGSNGLAAWGQDSLIDGDHVQVVVSGSGETAGATALSGGTVRISNGSRIENQGTTPLSHAVVAATLDSNYPGARFEATDSTLVSAHGVGVALNGGAVARLTNTVVEAGRHAIGFEAAPAPLDAEATVEVAGGKLHSAEATVGAVSGRGTVTLSKGIQIASDKGVLAQVNPNATLTLNLDNVQTSGDLVALPGGSLDFNLDNGSALTGRAFHANHATVDASSLWTLTGDSVIASVKNGGTIAFGTPASGGFKTLSVTGDYIADGGRLTVNTALGNDASPTDTLIVQGNTSGTTSLHVNNAGGAGAYTTGDGIQVVQVDGASNGVFALDAPVVAGANEYLLAQGGKANPTDGDWYLRSDAPPVIPVDPVVPVVPVIPVDPVAPVAPAPEALDPTPIDPVAPQPATPLYRPEPAAYLANQAASVGMFEHSMHDRMGEPNVGKRGDDGRTSAAWVRVVRNQMDGTTGEGQLDAGTDTSVLQIGGELARWNGDSRFHFGLMGGTGRADTDVASNLIDRRAKGKVIGYNLGAYGTWFADATAATGLYVDGWLQYGRYDNKVQGDYLAEERYNASTWAASVEAGYAFALNKGGKTDFYIEPQAQAIFTDYSAARHAENNGTVVDDVTAGGWTTRLGARFYGHAAGSTGNLVQPFVTLNWWRDADRNVMSFNDTTLALKLPRDRYEIKLGGQARLGGGWTGWGNLGLAYGAGDYHDVNGELGLNYRW